MFFLVLHKSSISFIIELARSVMVQAERFDKHSVDTVVDEFQKYLKDYCSFVELCIWGYLKVFYFAKYLERAPFALQILNFFNSSGALPLRLPSGALYPCTHLGLKDPKCTTAMNLIENILLCEHFVNMRYFLQPFTLLS